jgi:hypothetical protein
MFTTNDQLNTATHRSNKKPNSEDLCGVLSI